MITRIDAMLLSSAACPVREKVCPYLSKSFSEAFVAGLCSTTTGGVLSITKARELVVL